MVVLWVIRGMFTSEIHFNVSCNIALGLVLGLYILTLQQRTCRPPTGDRRPAADLAISMLRLLAYCWFTLVMCTTAVLSDVTIMLRFRGWLVRPCFRTCGKRFQIASGVRINYTTRMSVGDDVYIAPGCWINAHGGVTLEDQVMLGPYTVLVTTEHARTDGSYRFGRAESLPIHIGRGSWTAAHVVAIKGVRIGRGVLVAAGAVVTKDLPDDCLAGGVPARVLRNLESATCDSPPPAENSHCTPAAE